MVIIYNIALIFIAAGLAADNLMLAFYKGNGISIDNQLTRIKKRRLSLSLNWVVVLILLFLIENMVLIYGEGFGNIAKFLIKGKEQLVAVGILFGMGIRMFHEAKIKNGAFSPAGLNTKSCIETILGTSVYIFVFGCTMAWLKIDHSKIQLILLPLVVFTYLSGILLGRYHFNKSFRYLNKISALMIIAGSLLLTLQYLKNIL